MKMDKTTKEIGKSIRRAETDLPLYVKKNKTGRSAEKLTIGDSLRRAESDLHLYVENNKKRGNNA